MSIDVRVARPADRPAAAAVLADAFEDDPYMSWLLRGLPDRRARLVRLFRAEMDHGYGGSGGVQVADVPGVGIGGAAMWAPPGRWRTGTLDTVRMLPTAIRVFGRHLVRASRIDAEIDDRHPDVPHWFLSAIGTSAAARGTGCGRALLETRLAECDRTRTPAYLESSAEVNIGYYERFGFAVTGEIALSDGGPSLWSMWREPRPDDAL